MRRIGLFFIALTYCSVLTQLRANDLKDLRTVVVRKALPAIAVGAEEWMADNDCVSCHRVTHGAWALNLAADLKSTVTAEQISQINSWSTDWTKVANPKVRADAKQDTTLQNDADTVTQALLGVAAVQNSFDDEWVDSYFESLLNGQQKEGFWKPGGQLPLQKRPKRETQEVTTMWVLLGLQELPLPHSNKSAVTRKAKTWLNSEGHISEGKSIEWWALKTLLNNANGDEEQSAFAKLLSFQNEDGGWGWLVNEDSDALGTGLALYALAKDSDDEARKAESWALRFLSETQLEDGSWDVRGTKKTGRDDIVETASYWGTCWAVIGLMQHGEYLAQ